MAYERMNLKDGDVLKAVHISIIEDALEEIYAALGIESDDVPEYQRNEAIRVASSVSSWKAAHQNGLVFGAISDIHVYANDATREANTKTSIDHAAYALKKVASTAGCDFIVNMGDNCWENGMDTDNAMQAQEYVRDAIANTFSKFTSYRLVGNHDKSASTQKIYELIGVHNDFDAWGYSKERGFGYKDWTDKKVRIICLNTTDYMNISGGCALSYDQKDFLMRALDLSGKSDASKWQILILSHIPLDYDGGDYSFTSDLAAILSAYTSGTTATITVNSSSAVNEDPTKYATYSNGKLVYNYAGKNSARIIANIHGHVHNTCVGTIEAAGILRMSCPNTCFYETYQTKYGYGVGDEEYLKLVKTAGTAKDTAAIFFCVDLADHTITAIGYGAGGTDKTKVYLGSAYSVSLDLSNATSSNSATTATDGSSYTTTIAAKSGYVLADVKVTMGGANITSTAYSNGVVSISKVTGDIVITAKATVPTSYTNLFSTSDPDYSVGRLSSSGTVNTSYTGGFVSGFIRADYGDVIRARSASSPFLSNYGVVAFYNEDKVYKSLIYTNDTTGRIEMSSDNMELKTDTSVFSSSFSDMYYVRVMGYGSPDGFVITRNQEIK